jgi:hypothetical protein
MKALDLLEGAEAISGYTGIPVTGRDPIHSLRRLLKYALRSCGLRAVEVREEDASGGGSSAAATNTMTRNQFVVAALDDGLANQAAPQTKRRN